MPVQVRSEFTNLMPTLPRALVAWAELKGIGSYLDVSLLRALRAREKKHPMLRGGTTPALCALTVRRMLLEGVPSCYGLRRREQRTLHAIVREGLHAANADLEQRWQLENMIHSGHRPVDPVWCALAERLIEQRAQLRTFMLLAHVPLGRLRVEDGARPLFVAEVPHAQFNGRPLRATIPIALDDPEVAKPTCSCGARRCGRKLAALDALLALLFLPTDAIDPKLAAALATSGTRQWQRALICLDETIGQLDPGPECPTVYWEVHHDGLKLRARPLLARLGKRGVMLEPRPVSTRRLAAMDIALEAHDRHLLDVSMALEKQHSWHHANDRLAAALVGHPRLRRPGGETLTAVAHSVGITVVANGDGFELRATAGEHTWPAADLLTSAGLRQRGTLTYRCPSEGPLEVFQLSDRVRKVLETVALFGGHVPANRLDALLSRLGRLGRAVPVSVPPELGGERLDAETRLVARLTPGRDRAGLTVELLARAHPNAPAYAPGHGPHEVIAIERGGEQRVTSVVRDPAVEIGLARDMARELFDDDSVTTKTIPDQQRALAVVARLVLPAFAAGGVRETLDGVGEFAACRDWTAALEAFEQVRGYAPQVPPSFDGVLRPYQREGFHWLARLARLGAGACLADDMGLGKTIQALAAVTLRADDGPTLVVAPTSVCFNWQREARCFSPGLRPLLYMGSDRSALLGDLGARDLLITSYAVMARDAQLLGTVRFATVVFDEAQAVKNADTARARAARKLRADFRLALTGTPVENSLGDLWSLFDLIVPGLLGSRWEFRERFIKGGAVDDLAAIVRPFLLRRTKENVAPELPPRTEMVVDVLLDVSERATYESARLAAAAALERMHDRLTPQQARVRVLAALTRLRQLTCHSGLDDPQSPARSSKIDCLVALLRSLVSEGRRALVFSQFTRLLGRVATVLDAEEIPFLSLDGSTPAVERARLVQAFQRGNTPVFLISLKAGGTGLNLTAADTVFHLDPWWNPAVEDQATDRTHRIGQTRPVSVYRLVARDTVEEAVLRLHELKRALSDRILDGADVAATLSTEELLGLVGRRARAA